MLVRLAVAAALAVLVLPPVALPADSGRPAKVNLYVVYGPVCGKKGCNEYPEAHAVVKVYRGAQLIRTTHTGRNGHVIFPIPGNTRVKITVRATIDGVPKSGTTLLPAIPSGAVLNWTSRFCGNIC